MGKQKRVIVNFTSQAEKDLKKLKKDNIKIFQRFLKQIQLLEQDINYPSLHLKKYHHNKNSNLWEIRVNISYRAVMELTEIEDSYIFTIIKIGKHDILDNF